ncbi:MAG TPA: hypothetical protein VM513_28050 [Kofleriaceae bacterium]|jgi:hypothetical protein|nr:hypothetical protein [Kofleriaceae bacterium]
MFGICARRSILAVAMLFAFANVGEAAPSDWSDIVDPSLARPARTQASQRVATTSKAKTRAHKTKTKKMRSAKRSAAKAKAKPRAHGKHRR